MEYEKPPVTYPGPTEGDGRAGGREGSSEPDLEQPAIRRGAAGSPPGAAYEYNNLEKGATESWKPSLVLRRLYLLREAALEDLPHPPVILPGALVHGRPDLLHGLTEVPFRDGG